ncbi:glutamate-1-semialdehyde 2,1-aminomutase [Trueperella bialowiezensis]|uniref:Glutamate-1-semialdehyde 2,1-aminomutase n=1 Tax=Trueperella bialowiezensis TaxID=312285 RepID=A0A3S5EW29_9ACTO|nr:glutamate-1-semialdehyde 2,1-aminomutase [Trueperella bialowiezensis]VEI13389.1 Glutamate-1-semialdehyde 2,1-aminomutase 2 [Trueperella bialowiezensis]
MVDFERAKRAIPGGVDSPVRAFGSVGGAPVFIDRARGAYTYSGDREFVDLVGSWGPALLGHAHPEVVDAVQRAAARGLSFGAPTLAEVELAEVVIDRVEPVEKVRFVSTGTEATMTAIRLARGFTGRDLIVKFAGCYHGHEDALLVAAGSGVATFGMSSSAGVPDGTVRDTVVVEYNNRQAITDLFAEHGDRIAAIITEAAPANMGVIAPDPGFNAFLKSVCERHDALLIYDEVLTGFRLSPAGMWGIDQDEPYAPDIMTFGKVLGGGMPIAALGGRADVMDYLAPLGPVYQAGTLSGNPLATASGLATLRLADAGVYGAINRAADAVASGISEALSAEGVTHHVQRVGSLFSILFAEGPARSWADVEAQEQFRFPAFFHSFLADGVHLPPSVFEAYFVSAAHDDAAITRILEAAPRAARAAAQARP